MAAPAWPTTWKRSPGCPHEHATRNEVGWGAGPSSDGFSVEGLDADVRGSRGGPPTGSARAVPQSSSAVARAQAGAQGQRAAHRGARTNDFALSLPRLARQRRARACPTAEGLVAPAGGRNDCCWKITISASRRSRSGSVRGRARRLAGAALWIRPSETLAATHARGAVASQESPSLPPAPDRLRGSSLRVDVSGRTLFAAWATARQPSDYALRDGELIRFSLAALFGHALY